MLHLNVNIIYVWSVIKNVLYIIYQNAHGFKIKSISNLHKYIENLQNQIDDLEENNQDILQEIVEIQGLKDDIEERYEKLWTQIN